MPDLLIELFSEEIPARMQARAAEDLASLVTAGLKEAGLAPGATEAHAGPRRLVLSITGLEARTADVTEERRGPRVDAPDAAIQGFLKSAGVTLDQCAVQEDKKGKVYIARISRPGRATADVVAELLPDVIRRFPWPKSMRWGAGQLRWVRPLHSIVCLFDGRVVEFEVEDIRSGDRTRGHRFMAPGEIRVESFPQYVEALKDAKVIVSAEARAEIIRRDAARLAGEARLSAIEDEGLVRETAGLVEWPVVLMGAFDKAFLDVPPEVIATSLKAHQKCFALRAGVEKAPFETRPAGAPQGEEVLKPHPEVRAERASKDGALANRYLLVANLQAKDGGEKIVAGNDRVIAARLSDARFFWEQDRKTPLEDLLPKLEQITFHAKLGTQRERVARIEALSAEIARIIGADEEKARLAARLAKADLVTGMVGEFPELQGLMGCYYAKAEGIDAEVAEAIRDHYRPQGPSDTVPASKVAQAVALADKLDTLVGFWAIDEKPTGSKDPYALRRAALGVIRTILASEIRLRLATLVAASSLRHVGGVVWRENTLCAMEIVDSDTVRNLRQNLEAKFKQGATEGIFLNDILRSKAYCFLTYSPHLYLEGTLQVNVTVDPLPDTGDALECEFEDQIEWKLAKFNSLRNDLLSFFADRLKVYLREQGARHDLIDAVFSLGGQDDLLMIVRRVEALGKFLDTEDGKNLLAGVKRASSILRIEEKKDGRRYDGEVVKTQLVHGDEKALASAIDRAEALARKAVEAEDFEGAMAAIAKLRGPVDAFFDNVTVNADDPSFRENRLKLLNRIRAATLAVADFSRIEG